MECSDLTSCLATSNTAFRRVKFVSERFGSDIVVRCVGVCWSNEKVKGLILCCWLREEKRVSDRESGGWLC